MFGDYSEQWKLQHDTSIRILHKLCSETNGLQHIIMKETDKMCEMMAKNEGEIVHICDLLEYDKFFS